MTWNAARWPNFSEKELSCPCCDLFVQNDHALDCLQKLRSHMGPLTIDSGTRCKKHNAEEGGATHSQHLNGRAFDVAVGSYDRSKLYEMAKASGFQGFGFGTTFLHVDTGNARHWDYGEKSREAWRGIMP